MQKPHPIPFLLRTDKKPRVEKRTLNARKYHQKRRQHCTGQYSTFISGDNGNGEG